MNKMRMTGFYLLVIGLFFALPGFSQEEVPVNEDVYTEETGLWSTIDLGKKWDNGIAINFEEETRTRDNFMTTDRFMTSFDLSYKPVKFLKAGASYTRISYNKEGKESTNYLPYWEKRNRYCAYVQGEYSLGRFEVSLKERFQSTYRIGVKAKDDRANPKFLLRSKMGLSYDVKGISLQPFVSYEMQHSLNDPTGVNGLVGSRFAVGVGYEFNDGVSVECGYIRDMDKEDLVKVSVLSLGIGYSF